jgi:hypothetical protein
MPSDTLVGGVVLAKIIFEDEYAKVCDGARPTINTVFLILGTPVLHMYLQLV